MSSMIANVRIKNIREYRRLRSKELARMAGISPAALSLIEKKQRLPRIDTFQRIAAALEVSTSYLLGEEDAESALPRALASQSLKILLREADLSQEEQNYLGRVLGLDSAPQTVKGWRDLLTNVAELAGKRKTALLLPRPDL